MEPTVRLYKIFAFFFKKAFQLPGIATVVARETLDCFERAYSQLLPDKDPEERRFRSSSHASSTRIKSSLVRLASWRDELRNLATTAPMISSSAKSCAQMSFKGGF